MNFIFKLVIESNYFSLSSPKCVPIVHPIVLPFIFLRLVLKHNTFAITECDFGRLSKYFHMGRSVPKI